MSTEIRLADRPGDLGWVVMAHGEEYAKLGWNGALEVTIVRIVADYAGDHDPAREAAWIAEVDGSRAGSIFCIDAGDGVAKLRILLVTEAARGLGLGRALVETAVAFARGAGYRQMVLWTNSPLTTARRIYEGAGFTLVEEWEHSEFGFPMHGQNWALELEVPGRLRR